ncbi:MAG: phosphate ABC transporter substrate-binding/OmpA family protein [Filomicrobium sp.]
MGRTTATAIKIAVYLLGILGATSVLAADVTLRMKGGGFEINGSLQSFDGKAYVIRSEEFGEMNLNAKRFDCIGAACPNAQATGSLATPTGGPAGVTLPTWVLGDATLVGGNAIGTHYIPELVAAFAAANGYIIKKSIGRDTRDLTFVLTDRENRTVGRVFVKRHGVPAGMADLLEGKADLVWSGAPATEQDVRAFANKGINIRSISSEHVFALDALAVLVHPQNPLLSLSIDQIADIFAGRVTDWIELGGTPGPINVYAPVAGMGAGEAFENLVLNPRNLKLSENATRLESGSEWTSAVASDPLGIGFNMLGYISGTKPLNIKQSCGLVSKPTVFSAKTEEFPLARRLYFYTRGDPTSRITRALLEFALSPGAQVALKNAKFVDQQPDEVTFREQASRVAYALTAQNEDFSFEDMPNLLTDISRANRLSTTFRFNLGSAFLDTKAEQDIERLAKELQKPAYEGRSVMLLGFADSLGRYEVNLEVSKARADTVANALKKAGYAEAVAKAYGELAPIACNDTPEGRNLNRRVEVWIK